MSDLSNCTLWEALVKFSNNKLWNEYIVHRDQSGDSSDSLSKLPKEPSIQEGILNTLSILSEYQRNRDKEKKLFNNLVNQFKLKFNSKKLFAYGYSIPRKANDKPNLIPFDVIANGEINWGNSSIKGNGLEFVGVTVFKKPLVNELNESSNSIGIKRALTNKPNKGKGRPTNKDLIKTTYLEEKEKGSINYSNPKNKIFGELEIVIAERADISLNKDTKRFKGLGYTAMDKCDEKARVCYLTCNNREHSSLMHLMEGR